MPAVDGAPGPEPVEPIDEASQEARTIEALQRIARAARITTDQQQYAEGFRAGVRVGAAEAEARSFDATLSCSVPPLPSTFDAAVEALTAASRMVQPIDATVLPETREKHAEAAARATVAVADELVRWLSEHIEAGPCDYAIDGEPVHGRGQSISEPVIDEVRQWAVAPRCPTCGVSMSGAGTCSDPWCPAGAGETHPESLG